MMNPPKRIKAPAVLRAISEMEPDFAAKREEQRREASTMLESVGVDAVLQISFTKDHYLRLLAESDRTGGDILEVLGRMAERLPPAPQEYSDIADLIFGNER